MNARHVGNLLVVGQFSLLGVIIAGPGPRVFTVGGALTLIAQAANFVALVLLLWSAVQLGKSLTAHPLPKESAELIATGLYAHMRHPIYFFLMVFAALSAVTNGSVGALISAVALIVLLNFKARFEERALREKFAGYDSYAAKVPRFFPRFALRNN